MARFRKKPVEVEAWHFRKDMTFQERLDLLDNVRAHIEIFADAIVIDTLEGRMRADLGDWIIKGVKGEFYPCKPDVFALTYEAIE